eukprot:scaffold26486_cov118-Isochrysis_galbana.AAC.1
MRCWWRGTGSRCASRASLPFGAAGVKLRSGESGRRGARSLCALPTDATSRSSSTGSSTAPDPPASSARPKCHICPCATT